MSESDGYIDHAEEERLSVFAKYDKGRDEGAKIDDWEDPTLEIYHVMDRYGFIHDREVPRLKAEEKRANLELERSEKWLKMTQPARWPHSKSSEKLKSRTYKGIPNKLRPKVWGLFLNLQTIKEQQRGKYEEMYELARGYSPDVRQIDLDVNRTYRDTIMFRQRYGKEQKALFNILCAYSIYNSEVGYCQGMSQVAALLLMYLEEEDAFWGLAQLMTHTRYGMHGFFIAGFPKLVRFQAHHDKVMQQMLPKLKRHFDKHGVDCGLYTLKWFFQCFLDRVPFELSLRLWDIFLLEGDRVLICGAYTILKIHQKQLLARKNMDDILNYIQVSIPAHFAVDNDKAMEEYKKFSEELHSKKLDTGGEPSDDELPKNPFGIIEHIPKHVPKEIPKPKIETETSQLPIFRKKSPSPPPPPPRSPNNIHDKSYIASTHNHTAKASPSPDHLGVRKRVPPSVNPRRLLDNTVVENNISGDSSSETVRIHVPYSIPTPIPQPQVAQLSPRNGYDINKSDPNIITIDVSSHSTSS